MRTADLTYGPDVVQRQFDSSMYDTALPNSFRLENLFHINFINPLRKFLNNIKDMMK